MLYLSRRYGWYYILVFALLSLIKIRFLDVNITLNSAVLLPVCVCVLFYSLNRINLRYATYMRHQSYTSKWELTQWLLDEYKLRTVKCYQQSICHFVLYKTMAGIENIIETVL